MRETPQARAAYAEYLQMGPGRRSLARLAALLGRPAHYRRTLERWSTAHGWAQRVAAHDARVLRTATAEGDKLRQHAQAETARNALHAARYLASVLDDERTTPILDRQGKVIGRKPLVRASTKVEAAKHLLGCAGVVPVQRQVIEQLEGGDIDAAAGVVGRMSDDALRVLREQLAAEKERIAAGEGTPDDDA